MTWACRGFIEARLDSSRFGQMRSVALPEAIAARGRHGWKLKPFTVSCATKCVATRLPSRRSKASISPASFPATPHDHSCAAMEYSRVDGPSSGRLMGPYHQIHLLQCETWRNAEALLSRVTDVGAAMRNSSTSDTALVGHISCARSKA